jgi:hypothetical protein
MIVASAFLFISTALIWRSTGQNVPIKNRYASRALLITGMAALIAGWYFARNMLLYNGDVFTRVASRNLAEIHAVSYMRPSVRLTPEHMRISLNYMLVNMGWFANTAKSFVAAFGYMQIFLPKWIYWLLAAVLAVFCIAGLRIKKWLAADIKWKLLGVALTSALAGNLFIDLYYSYYEDYQPQGRYLMEGMLLPLFLLFAVGADKLNSKIFNNRKISVQYLLIGFIVLLNLYSYRLIWLSYM